MININELKGGDKVKYKYNSEEFIGIISVFFSYGKDVFVSINGENRRRDSINRDDIISKLEPEEITYKEELVEQLIKEAAPKELNRFIMSFQTGSCVAKGLSDIYLYLNYGDFLNTVKLIL